MNHLLLQIINGGCVIEVSKVKPAVIGVAVIAELTLPLCFYCNVFRNVVKNTQIIEFVESVIFAGFGVDE